MKKKYLLTPGPTPVPAEVLAKEGMPIIHHRTTEFSNIFLKVEENLKKVFFTNNDVLLLSSSGTGAMEAAIVNLMKRDAKAIVLETGVFGSRWGKILQGMGLSPIILKENYGEAVSLERLETVLKENPDVLAVFGTLTETSTATVNDVREIAKIVNKTDAVLVIDAVSGLVGEELYQDEWGVDVVVSGSQKGFMLPPGLSFISMNEKAWKLTEKSDLPKFYFDLKKYKSKVTEGQTPFTPPVSLIVALDESLNIVLKEGLENLFNKYKRMGNIIREAMKALGLELFSKNPSNVVTAVKSPDGIDSSKIVKLLREKYGVSIAGGQMDMKGKIFRIAHMGYMDKFDLIIGVSAIEMGLKELGYNLELGKGIKIVEENILSCGQCCCH